MTPATAVMEMISPSDVQAIAETARVGALAFVEHNKVDVVDLVSLERAVQIRTAIGERKKDIEAKLASPKSWAFKLHRWFCDLENAAFAPYDQLDFYERRQISDFKAAEDRKREARERELAEQVRREADERAAIEAAALETSGDHEMAEAVIAEAIAAPMPVVVVANELKTVAGLKFTRRWLWRYPGGTDTAKTTAPAAVARTMALIPREFLKVDEQKVSAHVKAMKGSAKIPGIETYYVDDPVR